MTGICEGVHVAARGNKDEARLDHLFACASCCTSAVPLFCLDELCLFKTQLAKLIMMSMQADQIHLIALKVQRKYYSEPSRDSQRWTSRHDQLLKADMGLPKQELPATMLSMDYTRV